MAPVVCVGLFLAFAVTSQAERAPVIVDDGLSMMQVNHLLSHKLFEHQARAPPLEQVNHQLSHKLFEHQARSPLYAFEMSGSCAHPVLTIDECSTAAEAIVAPIAAQYDSDVGASALPPYCYFAPFLQAIFFNVGSNTGSCSGVVPCICRTSASAPTPAATPAPTPAPTLPQACVDTDGTALDKYGFACDDGYLKVDYCGNYDDSDFSSNIMCCCCTSGACGQALGDPICSDGFPLTPVLASECPANLDIANCESVAPGALCNGNGECGTDSELDNCGVGYNIYRKSMDACTVGDGSGLSSQYPCGCGSATCVANEVCDAISSLCTGDPTAAPTVSPTSSPSAVPTPATTEDPTAAPTVSPTSSPSAVPTAATTEAPTPAPSSGASASGDPHVTNVDGARFDIMKAGVHEFLRLPRRTNQSHGSAEPDPLLSVLAAVERPNEDECHESYVKQVDVTGAWLNSSGPLRFRAIGESSDSAQAIMLSVNGSLVDVPALSRDSRVHSFLEVVEPSTPRAKHVSGAVQKVPMLTVKLSFSGAILKIDWMHRAVPSGQSLNHLNFQANGLRRLLDSAGMDIGGILGRDDHSEAASLPSDCKPAGADLRVASRASGQEGDLQIITAAL